MNRRQFLSASAAATVAIPTTSTWAAGVLLKHSHALGYNAAGKPMKAAVIGPGWFGMVNCRRMLEVAPEIQVAAMADVDSVMLDNSVKQVVEKGQKEPKKFKDYRQMLSDDKYDIVIVGSPDHWHALHMIAAVEAGSDVYVEKPISHDIAEGQAMLAAARKHNRVVQVGTQRRSTPHVNNAKEFIQSGKLGTIARVETCCYYHMRTQTTAPDCPASCHLRLRLLEWPGTAGCLSPRHPSPLLAKLLGVWQRHLWRHVRSLARHHPLHPRPRLNPSVSLPRVASTCRRNPGPTSLTRKAPSTITAT
jgi:hypothetical protein